MQEDPPKRPKFTALPKAHVSFPWGKEGIPAWYPRPWALAVDYTKDISKSDERRQHLINTLVYPVPELSPVQFRMPIPQHLGNASASNQSKMFATLCDILNPWTTQLAAKPVHEIVGFTASEWKDILKGYVRSKDSLSFAARLGIKDRMPRDEQMAVEVEDSSALPVQLMQRLEMQKARDDQATASSASSSTSASTSPTTTTSALYATPATSRAPSPPLAFYNDDSDDDDDYGDRRLPHDPRFTLTQLPAPGERPLAVEDVRYLYEPSGWRKKGVNMQRALKEFTWWKEVDVDDEGMAEFALVSTGNRDWQDNYSERDIWWCYEHGWCMMFERFLDGAGAHGERLTKPIKLFVWGGNRSKKNWRTKAPVQLRVWHAQSLEIPYV